jgi:hypothetical protein
MKAVKVTEHPEGGKIHWFKGDGRVFSVLDNNYPYADDFELHERHAGASNIEESYVLPDTEKRFTSLSKATAWIENEIGGK